MVKLDDVSEPALAANDPAIAGTQQEFGSCVRRRICRRSWSALPQREVGVKKNQAAIDAVAKQLTGQSQ